MRLSVVIPTLNEAAYLPAALDALERHAAAGGPCEVIVADCGSADGTAEIARARGCRVVAGEGWCCRGQAADAGAREAAGDVLLFLDADTRPPAGYDREIEAALARPRVVGGAFEFELDGRGWPLRVVELVDRIRYRVRRFYYGDQALFVRAEAFRRVGGFPPVELFETAELCRRLRRVGRLVLVSRPAATSPRRFQEGGVWRVFLHDVYLWALHLCGRRFEHHAPAYWQENRRRG